MSLNVRRQGWDGRQLEMESLEERRLLAIDFGLLQDINPFLNGFGSDPSSVVAVGAIGYFTANNGAYGKELWRTDGTEAGTTLVKDIAVGSESSHLRDLLNVNGTLFFVAEDEAGGAELWKSNGTAAGTVRVKDIRLGQEGSNPQHLANLNGVLLFSANDGFSGQELWRSDGTSAGTTLVKDVYSGSGSAYSTYGTNVGGTLFFLANDGLTGRELWKSDGTAAGTALVKDVRPGGSNGFGYNHPQLINSNGTLFFAANDGANGLELWKSAGTAATTSMVANIGAGSENGLPSSFELAFAAVGGVVYFAANDGSAGLELWKSDGAVAGTTMVKDIATAPFAASSPAQLVVAGSVLFFTANNGTSGQELWKSDGSAAGTVMVKEIAAGSVGSSPTALSAAGNHVYFGAHDGVNGLEVWRSDGTAAGTTMLETAAGPGGIGLSGKFRSLGNAVLFTGNNNANGSELMRVAGSTTQLVKDILAGTSGSSPNEFTTFNGVAYFAATEGTMLDELWRTDGTSAGTHRVVPSSATSPRGVTGLTVAGNWLYFTAQNSSGHVEVWRTNGTAAGTTLLTGGPSGLRPWEIGDLAAANNTIYFTAPSGNVTALWKADAAGLLSAVPGVTFDDVTTLTSTGNSLFYVKGGDLWKTDGSATGTLLRDFVSPFAREPENLTSVGGAIYFTFTNVFVANELWKSDGTIAGTTLVKSFDSTQDFIAGPNELTDVNGILYFALGKSGDFGLWRSNGTAAGTSEAVGLDDALIEDIYNQNGSLFFRSNGGATSGEMWYSDGTAAGTVLLSSLMPAGSRAYYLDAVKVGDTIYFGANDGVSGEELWSTDLTVAGTKREADLVLGSGGSNPTKLLTVGNRLVMAATTPERGRELWGGALPSRPGDYNADGATDGADFLAWQRSFGSAATPAGSGADGDGNGTVGSGDLAVWKAGFGTGGEATLAASAAGAVASELSIASLGAIEEISTVAGDVSSNGAAFDNAADAAFAWLAGDRTATARDGWKHSAGVEVELLARDHVARSPLVPSAGTEPGEPGGTDASVRRIRGSEASLGTDDAISEGEDALTAELCGLTASSAFLGRDALMKAI